MQPDEMYRLYYKLIFSYILKLTDDYDSSQEIANDTFLKAYAANDAGRYLERQKLISWLLRIAHRTAIDFFRHRRRIRRGGDALRSLTDADVRRIADTTLYKEADAFTPGEYNAVVEALDELKKDFPLQHDTLLLHYLKGYQFKDIAKLLGVPVNTSLSHGRYGVRKMQLLLGLRTVTIGRPRKNPKPHQ